MITKEKLLLIRNLELSDILDKMDDDQFSEYCKELDVFTEVIPNLEGGLKKALLEDKNIDLFSKAILNVMDSLIKIHAKDLAQNIFNILAEVRAENNEAAAASLESFLSAVSTLSIDIQLAKYDGLRKYIPKSADEQDNSQKSILAVDDAPFLLNVLKASLMNSGYKFTGVTSGNAALKFLENHRPNLFILDIEMPEMNGYELANRIRKCGQEAPIIFLTGNSTADYVIKAILAGAADFIVKPVNKEQVLEKIKKYIV